MSSRTHASTTTTLQPLQSVLGCQRCGRELQPVQTSRAARPRPNTRPDYPRLAQG